MKHQHQQDRGNVRNQYQQDKGNEKNQHQHIGGHIFDIGCHFVI